MATLAQTIEARALRVVERINGGHPPEDSLVELKSEWPTDFYKTARQIAGHANAARGEPILWLIGVDETLGVVEAITSPPTELADWRPRIEKCFHGPIPRLAANLTIDWNNRAFVALYFETDRAPYVVNAHPDHPRTIQREIPWRVGNRTESATHADMVQMFLPQPVPAVAEFVNLQVYQREEKWPWYIIAQILIVPPFNERVTLLDNSLSGSLYIPGAPSVFTCKSSHITAFYPPGAATLPTGGGFIERPSAVGIDLRLDQEPANWTGENIEATVRFSPIGGAPFSVSSKLEVCAPDEGMLRKYCLIAAPR